MVDREIVKRFTQVPAVGTACGPAVKLLSEYFGSGFTQTFVPDGFCLFQKAGASPSDLKTVFVSHMDEIGGCVYGLQADGSYTTRIWGTRDPSLFANANLQAFDYLAEDESSAFPVTGEIADLDGELKLILRGDKITPYRTVFTFDQETTFTERDGDTFAHGKAVDPRATLFAVCEAVKRFDSPSIAAVIVMAEECAMDVARKAVTFLSRNAPNLNLVVNADVPLKANLGDARLDMPAIRVFEGHNFIDPSFGIKVVSELIGQGISVHLSAARSGSQTILFTPLAPTLSIALPAENIHTAVGTVSMTGIERCLDLLIAIGERY
jgi:putative aminopeptidase FrvX